MQEIIILLDSFSNSDLFSSTIELKKQIAQFNNLLKAEELLLPRNSELKDSFQVAKSELLYSALGSVLSMANEIADIDPTGKISNVLDTIASTVKFARTTHINDNIYRMEHNLSKMRETNPKLIKINQNARSSLEDISNDVSVFVKEATPPADVALVNEPVIVDTTIDNSTDLTDEILSEIPQIPVDNFTDDDDDDDNNNQNNFPFLGFVAGKVSGETYLFTNNLYTGKREGGDAPQGERGEARINRNGTNKFYSDGLDSPITVSINESESADGYKYSDWGEWNGTGITIASPINKAAERGVWVIGHSTKKEDVPTFGSAQYNGQVAGIAFNGENIGGTVQLNANFANHNVNGNLNLTRANGSNWVNIQTGDMSYDNIYNNHDFEINFQSANATVTSPNGSVISNAGANVGGMFIGTQAQEIVGEFAVYNIPDSVGGADGVFRAKK